MSSPSRSGPDAEMVANHMYREGRSTHPNQPNIDPHPVSLSITLRRADRPGVGAPGKQGRKSRVAKCKRDPNGNGGTKKNAFGLAMNSTFTTASVTINGND